MTRGLAEKCQMRTPVGGERLPGWFFRREVGRPDLLEGVLMPRLGTYPTDEAPTWLLG